ncbi:protein tiptop isoform X2 [Contarinia nasturtii]|uniref:protein tiptop isoform X2 n=1 Tax=Contarinia nasturtii TaxID=265458 RepID=UPI0012D43619|nr:protein tiptop isoform X2 [Contarinia nasturtii]
MHQLDQMMLHEAVMLEIYRQALSARDTSSPRCSSRNSSNGGGRCPSADSNYSDRQSSNAAGSTATSPLALPIPPILPAAALLPSQSAAMAAYLGAAAVAAQQNRLLLGGHALGLGRDASPPFLPLQSPIGGDTPVLDFSTKRKSQDFDDIDRDQHNKSNDDDDSNLKSDNDPLDLSVSRKRCNNSPPLPPPASHGRKLSRTMDYKPPIGSPWSSPSIAPYFAGTNASTTSPSPKTHHLSHASQHQSEWNGLKNKMSTPNDATKALEKMSELSRLGGNEVGRQSTTGSSSSNTPSTGRHSAWQSHWLNKGADSVKDVFKCVWCKQSFPTLETLTIHMKETQHLGVNMDGQRGHNHQSQQPHNSHPNQNHAASNSSSSTSSSTSKADLHLMIKETMPLPRKLVRGQDVWLGKGAEQTRQILKCMWCGQSFRSLSEMTTHMQQTQHYTNIISQEQIISWKSSDDMKGGSSGGGANNSSSNGSNSASGNISTVSAVLTCKVCDQAFSSLKDLSNHMVKNAHYKEHIMRSISESGGRRRQTREKRKKSLPVRKLLEIERAQNEYKNGDNSPITKTLRDAGSGRITCEKCGDKIDTNVFVEHIRQCIGAAAESSAQRNLLKNNILMPDSIPRDGRKSIGGDDSNASQSSRLMSPNLSSKEGSSTSGDKTGSPSVLNAIEQLIEKSFDTRSRHVTSNFTANSQQNAPLGSSILKRLGIDESVDYTKPLIDTQTMNLLRGFSQQSASSTYSHRERSASESSSVSDRGSSVIETSMTPERKTDSVNNGRPRDTPDKCSQYGDDNDENEAISLKIKTDPEDNQDKAKSTSKDTDMSSMSIKKEMTDDENDQDDRSENANERRAGAMLSPALSSKRSNSGDEQRTPLASPNSDALSPRSTPETNPKKSKSSIPTNSLGALSSMFDSLAGTASTKTVESGKKNNSNPLAALQKLCDKTENAPINKANNSQNLAVPVQQNNTPSTASGAMLAFSWACNDGMVNAADSAIKCAFCDTPFSSKGAYRHHLSKVHFVKDDNLLDPIIAKAQKLSASRRTPPSQAHSPRSVSSSTSSSGNGLPNNRLSKSPTPPASALNSHQSTSNASQSSTSGANFEESPHSKFLKYTELAKQLSSKYV